MPKFDLSKLDFLTKFTVFLLIIPASSFFISNQYLWVMAVVVLLTIFLAKLDLEQLWKNLRTYLIALAVLLLILLPVVSPGRFLPVFLVGLSAFIRLALFLISGLIYSMITNASEIPQALMRIKIPHRYGILFMIGMRLYPLVLKEAETIRDALRSRGLEAKFSLLRPKESLTYLGYLMQPILLATVGAGMKIGETLALRGYDPYGKITVPPGRGLKLPDYFILAIAMSVLVIAVVIR